MNKLKLDECQEINLKSATSELSKNYDDQIEAQGRLLHEWIEFQDAPELFFLKVTYVSELLAGRLAGLVRVEPLSI